MKTQQRPAIAWYIYAYTITKQRNKIRDYIHTLYKETVLPGGRAFAVVEAERATLAARQPGRTGSGRRRSSGRGVGTGIHGRQGAKRRIVERKCHHRHLWGPGLPDAVGVSRHGPDISEVTGRDLAAHLSRESLKPGGLKKNTRRLTPWEKR